MKKVIRFLIINLLTMLVANSLFAMSRGKPVEEKPVPPKTNPVAPPPNSSNPTAPTGDTAPLWEAKIKNSKEWTSHVYIELDRLGQDLLDVIPADIVTYCPNYKNLSYEERKKYWIYLISAMVRFESNFDTNVSYKEGFNDSRGKPVISRGLLQISKESANGYECGIYDEKNLHDPLINLSCGVRILDRWVSRDGRIAGKVSGKWRGAARYWAVMREGDKTSYKSILSWSKNLNICNY
jgi:hypothetical protein